MQRAGSKISFARENNEGRASLFNIHSAAYSIFQCRKTSGEIILIRPWVRPSSSEFGQKRNTLLAQCSAGKRQTDDFDWQCSGFGGSGDGGEWQQKECEWMAV